MDTIPVLRGVHPSEAMMHSPCFRFPPYFRKNSDCGKFSNFYLLLKNFSIFIRPKFLMTFFSHRPQISNSPYFPCFSTFPPCFAKIIISPYFEKCPPCFRKIHLLLHTLCAFRFPPTLTMMQFCITQQGRPVRALGDA